MLSTKYTQSQAPMPNEGLFMIILLDEAQLEIKVLQNGNTSHLEVVGLDSTVGVRRIQQ